MARRALWIIGGIVLPQFHMGIMTSGAGEPPVVGVVAATVEEAVWLKADVVNTTQIRHHRNRVNAPVAGAAELLRQGLGIKRLWVKYVETLACCGLHRLYVFFSRAMAGLATHPGNQIFEAKFVFRGGAGAMTAEAVPCFVTADVTAQGLPKSRGWVQNISDGPIQSIDRGIVADARFVQLPVLLEYVSLRDMCIPECVDDWFTDRLFTVRHAVQDLPSITCNLVSVGSGPKGHSGMGPQHAALRGCLKSMSHGGAGL